MTSKFVTVTRAGCTILTIPESELKDDTESVLDNIVLWTLNWGQPIKHGDLVSVGDLRYIAGPKKLSRIKCAVSNNLGFTEYPPTCKTTIPSE